MVIHCPEGICPFVDSFPSGCPGDCCYIRGFMRDSGLMRGCLDGDADVDSVGSGFSERDNEQG
jgi:hypothetical protein